MQVKIMRGCSGSGKSTYIKNHFPDAYVCSADDFWLDKDGNYKFDLSKHGQSHAWCLRKFIDYLEKMRQDPYLLNPSSCIVVDNTNKIGRAHV